jgi:hypothetical protein
LVTLMIIRQNALWGALMLSKEHFSGVYYNRTQKYINYNVF